MVPRRDVCQKKHLDNPAKILSAYQIRPDSDDVAVILFTGALCGKLIVNRRGAHSLNLVGDHVHSHAVAVDQDAKIKLPRRHGQRQRKSNVRVIDSQNAVAAEVFGQTAKVFSVKATGPVWPRSPDDRNAKRFSLRTPIALTTRGDFVIVQTRYVPSTSSVPRNPNRKWPRFPASLVRGAARRS